MLGKNTNQTFNIYTGRGRNGKSKLVELMSMVLGDYKATVPITLITQKRGSIGGTSSEIVQLMGVRYAVMQEPSVGDVINEGIMKEITGGDKIEARPLYSEPIEFKPQFKLLLTCNDLPEMPGDDEGTWRRVRAVEFPSKFTKYPNPKNKYEFEIDTELAEKFPDWAEPFMSLLLNYHKEVYSTKGLHEPEEVLKVTNNYKRANDINIEFFDNSCTIEENENGSTLWIVVQQKFKQYLKETNHNNNVTKKVKDLKIYMEDKYGKLKNNKWNGISIRDDEEQMIEDE